MNNDQLLALADALTEKSKRLNEAVDADEFDSQEVIAVLAAICTAAVIADALRDVVGRED